MAAAVSRSSSLCAATRCATSLSRSRLNAAGVRAENAKTCRRRPPLPLAGSAKLYGNHTLHARQLEIESGVVWINWIKAWDRRFNLSRLYTAYSVRCHTLTTHGKFHLRGFLFSERHMTHLAQHKKRWFALVGGHRSL